MSRKAAFHACSSPFGHFSWPFSSTSGKSPVSKCGGSERYRSQDLEELLPVRERTCLLFARGPTSGGLPILEVSIVEVIVKRGRREGGERGGWEEKMKMDGGLICAIRVTSVLRFRPHFQVRDSRSLSDLQLHRLLRCKSYFRSLLLETFH